MVRRQKEWAIFLLLALTAPFNTSADSTENSLNILVLGGTGRLGAAIATDLAHAEHSITVFARPTSDHSRLKDLQINFIVGDLEDQQSVVAAIDNQKFDVVVDASARRDNPNPFYGEVMGNLLVALKNSNVQQFILHGSIGAGDSAPVFSDAQYHRMREVMQAKSEAENLLKNSDIPYTIIRNGVIKFDGTPATGTAELTTNVKKMGAVTRLDLATLTMHCLANEQCMNETFHAVDDSWKDDPSY